MNGDQCRTYEVDGQPVRVRGDRPLTEQDQAALAEVVRAALALMASQPARHGPDFPRRPRCGCGHRHCRVCGEVWPCTAETGRRYAAAVETGDPT